MMMPALVFAQGGRKRMNDPKIKEQVEQIRKSTYTQVLSLTDAEAQKFWPVFDRMQDELEGIKKQANAIRKDIKENYDKSSDAELDKKLNQLFDFEQKMLDIKRKYYGEFKKVIPVKKVALLPKAEREFKKALIEKIRQRDEPDN
jgi:hypothetical protein